MYIVCFVDAKVLMAAKLSPVQQNLKLAKRNWGAGVLTRTSIEALEKLTERYQFSIASGDLRWLGGSWYVTHSALLHLALRSRCNGIHVEPVAQYCDPFSDRWVVKATVFKTSHSQGFVGYGDANPGNVSALVRGAELRMAETRAVNRALRKAYGIGICSVEELSGGNSHSNASPQSGADSPSAAKGDLLNGNRGWRKGNCQPRLRDRLLLLIRQHQLDPEQVKRYALHFCGTKSLRETSREQVENLIEHLSALAAEGRDKLIAQLDRFVGIQDAIDSETCSEKKEAA